MQVCYIFIFAIHCKIDGYVEWGEKISLHFILCLKQVQTTKVVRA